MGKYFDTYREAYAFYASHKNEIGNGLILTISADGHTVDIRDNREPEQPKRDRSHESNTILGIIKDDLPGGVNGMLSHADGKRYDSKSSYARALKAKGCRVVGNDWNKAEWKPPIERGVRGDFNVRPQLKEAVQKVMG